MKKHKAEIKLLNLSLDGLKAIILNHYNITEFNYTHRLIFTAIILNVRNVHRPYISQQKIAEYFEISRNAVTAMNADFLENKHQYLPQIANLLTKIYF